MPVMQGVISRDEMKLNTIFEFYQDSTNLLKLEAIVKHDDGSGLSSLLTIQSEPFSCYQHDFHFENLKSFCKEVIKLNRKLKGSAGIGPTRDNEFIKFECTAIGHIIVSGRILIYGEHSQSLNFTFVSDQSYLAPLAKSAESALLELKKK